MDRAFDTGIGTGAAVPADAAEAAVSVLGDWRRRVS